MKNNHKDSIHLGQGSISRFWQNRDKFILKGRHSSTIRRYIYTELFQIGNGGYYPIETLNIISVHFLHLILESVASFIGLNIIESWHQ